MRRCWSCMDACWRRVGRGGRLLTGVVGWFSLWVGLGCLHGYGNGYCLGWGFWQDDLVGGLGGGCDTP